MNRLRNILVGFLILNLVCLTPSRVQGRTEPKTPEEWRQLYADIKLVRTFIRGARPVATKHLAYYSQLHGTTIDLQNFDAQMQRLYPETYKYVKEQLRRQGLVNTSLPITNTSGKFVAEAVLGLLLTLLAVEVGWAMTTDADREARCHADLRRDFPNASDQDINKECNFQSDMAFDYRDLIQSIGFGPLPRLLQKIHELATESPEDQYSIWQYIQRLAGNKPLLLNQVKPPSEGGCALSRRLRVTSTFDPGTLPPGVVGPPSPSFTENVTYYLVCR
jgi:hypothetical protein